MRIVFNVVLFVERSAIKSSYVSRKQCTNFPKWAFYLIKKRTFKIIFNLLLSLYFNARYFTIKTKNRNLDCFVVAILLGFALQSSI